MTSTISAKNLAVGYDNTPVLQDIDFALRPGNMAVLIGANGSGKSTLLRTLAGVQAPLAGSACIGGSDVGSYRRRTLAQKLALVTTERGGGGGLTVEECVAIGRHSFTGAFGRPDRDDRAIISASMQAVGIADKANRHLATLSDGERQKVNIARALAQQAPVIVLDEPTAFLDVAGRLEITRLLRSLADMGRTVVLSTHDIAPAVAVADVLMVVDPQARTLYTGLKPDIIADSLIDRAFADRGLRFDPVRGDFR